MKLKNSKFFVLAILTLGLGLFIERYNFVYAESVQPGYPVSEMPDIWNETIAESINKKEITLIIDEKEIELTKEKVYMDANLNLMIPISVLKSNFDSGVHFYDNTTLLIEKNDISITLNKNDPFMMVNEETRPLSATLVDDSQTVYIPVDALIEGLKCSYSWDIETNTATINNLVTDMRKIPYLYDYREKTRSPIVQDQGPYGTCWAFASLTALESSLLPEEAFDFSQDHMSIHNSFSSELNDGGEYTMSIAYLASWQGPVLEKDDPYGDGESPEGLKAVKHVQEVQIIEGKDFDKIKEMVYKYGGVQSSLYTSLKDSGSRSIYYNRETYAYCYIGTEKPNHDVVIIGWDDNYSKDNFNMDLEADGAFICRNSWGEEFGDGGTFYVSYYDTNIGIHNVVYTGIEEADNYDNIYQSDLCGWVGQLGYGKEYAFFANVYKANSNEKLKAVSFYATGKDTEYEIYLVRDFEDTSSLNRRGFVKSGKFNNAGYYTVDLNTEIELKPGEKFAIVMKIRTPNSERPIAIEYAADESTKDVILTDGEGYISLQGKRWESSEETQNSNLCLKVFTDS